MEIICEVCNGTGIIVDSQGHRDICHNCMGLGTTVQNQAEKSEIEDAVAKVRTPIVRALWILAVVMAVYYTLFIIADVTYHFSLSLIIIILVAGHSASVGGFVLYLIWFSVPREL